MTDIKELITAYASEFNSRLPEFFPLTTAPEGQVVEAGDTHFIFNDSLVCIIQQ